MMFSKLLAIQYISLLRYNHCICEVLAVMKQDSSVDFVCVCVSGPGVHSIQARYPGTHRRDDTQSKLCHLLAAALSAHIATKVPASCHAQGM